MPCLEYLDASHNKIHKIENLQGCTALKVGHPSWCSTNPRLASRLPEWHSSFTGMQELVLNGNKITAIEGLGRCSRLTELALNGNRLTSLRGLKEVSSSIDVSRCRISDCLYRASDSHACLALLSNTYAVSFMPRRIFRAAILWLTLFPLLRPGNETCLQILWVCENQLESLRGIPDSLPKLTELYIADNKLTSLQPLDKCCPEMELLVSFQRDLQCLQIAAKTIMFAP